MMTLGIFKFYLGINFLALVAGVALTGILASNRVFTVKVSGAAMLNLLKVLLVLVFFLPLFCAQQEASTIWQPTAQVWASRQARNFTTGNIQAVTTIRSTSAAAPVHDLALVFPSLCALGFVVVGLRLMADKRKVRRLLRNGFTYKSIGQVHIVVSEASCVPFSMWTLGRAYVVLPQELVEHQQRFRIVVKHELQHHRQGDTRWLYLVQLLRACAFWNPGIILLQKCMEQIQEIACDEALTGHRGISSLAYGDCLWWVAQNVVQNRAQPVGTAGIVRGSAAKFLQWRIETMLKPAPRPLSRWAVFAIGIITSGLMAFIAAATQASIQDRRISQKDAEKMAEKVTSATFPIVVNDLVLQQLNRYLGTPDGREFMRKSLVNMKTYENTVIKAIGQYHLPEELLAVPLVESGYENLPPDGISGHGAGIWMFVRPTARSFGLRIDASVDERLDAGRETDAAMRLLAELRGNFQSWGLALLAYNCGPAFVEKAIAKTGSRDAWELVRQGFENDPNYLARVMAAVLILKNPDSLD